MLELALSSQVSKSGITENQDDLVLQRNVGVYAGAQEVLAIAGADNARVVWWVDCIDARVCNRAVHLHDILSNGQHSRDFCAVP